MAASLAVKVVCRFVGLIWLCGGAAGFVMAFGGQLVVDEGLRSAVTAGRRGACCAKRVGQRAAQSGRKNGKPGFLPEVRFQGGALVRAADKGEPVG